jgi:hypothetical protein
MKRYMARFTTATGYTDRGDSKLLPSGIRSHAIKWAGFEYDKNFTLPPAHKTFREYKPEGMITQLPALRPDYNGKIPPRYIRAATRKIKQPPWMNGVERANDLCVRFVIGNGRVTLVPKGEYQ